ncbi:Fic family protein [Solicola gregarius]|uniref:Fic family protein n=1 Tax=Solicola gregarius TaxID=2908642 RepID=A0AA46TLY8_9ACTN|nr:Fic family protein [Solicola gregarius]UYM07747.1 Fic family protein [Solicola gregarius]
MTVEVPPKIARAPVEPSPELVERCRYVEAEIARLDAQYGAQLVGLSSFLVRSESVASSRIEHVYADLDDIARASISEDASRAAQATAAAASAMSTLIRDQGPGEPFKETSVLEAHRDLLEDDLLERRYAGQYRDVQNWIGGSDFSPRNAVHLPPPATEVAPLMADLTSFMNRDDMPPVAQAALAHGQFEAIHPFPDGNGRIGRGLIAAILRRRGVARQVVVPVAATMLADVDAYFDALVAYRRGAAGTLVAYLATAAANATGEASISAERLGAMPQTWRDLVRPRANSSAAKLIDGLVTNPVINAPAAQRITGSATPRTYQAIERLSEAGVLREITGRSRSRVWVASDVVTEIGDLDERIGRRTRPSKRWA